MSCGVYCILNTSNDHRYIGRSNDIVRRWNKHRRELRSGTHYNTHLQAAWNKYGELAFHFGIIEEALPEVLQIVEQFWLDRHFALGLVYNTLSRSEGVFYAGEFTEEHRNKISESRASFADSEIRDMRKRSAGGVSAAELAREYDVHVSAMNKIVNYQTYKRVT